MGLTYPSNKICPRCGTGGYVWYLDNSEYVAKCINCNHYFHREDFPMCVLDEVPKPMTNADRIRMMTDEELAEYLFERGNGWENCYGICAYQNECGAPHCRKFCVEQVVKWLKQEGE